MSLIRFKNNRSNPTEKRVEGKKHSKVVKNFVIFLVIASFIPLTAFSKGKSFIAKNKNKTGLPEITVNSSKVVNEKISKLIFGINAASYLPENLSPEVLKYLGEWSEIIRWPSGANTEMYDWYTHTRTNFEAKPGIKVQSTVQDKSTLTSNFVNASKQVGDGAEVLVGVNTLLAITERKPETKFFETLKPLYSDGLPKGAEHAANWVKYANKDFGNRYGANEPLSEPLNIKYWEIGNELNLVAKRDLGMTNNEIIDNYNSLFRDYFNKMTAVDPKIKAVGPAFTNASFDEIKDSQGNVMEKSIMETFLEKSGDIVDVVSFHLYQRPSEKYPKYESLQKSIMPRVDEYAERIGKLREWINKYGVDTERRKKEDIKIALTEYNAGPSNLCENTIWDHAIWTADMIGMFMRENLYMANMWHIKMGNHSLYNIDVQNNKVTPNPAHYALKFMKEHSYVKEGSKLLEGVSSNSSLRVYPIEHDGKLSLIVINTSDKEDITAEINVDKKAGKYVTGYELSGVGEEVKTGVEKVNSKYTRTFKKHSVTCLEFSKNK